MPPAPATFSTTTCWPRMSLKRAARMRPSVSTGPPAAQGTTMVTARLGQSCALAVVSGASNNAIAAAPAMTLGMRSSRRSAHEHQKSRLVAHDRDVSLAGRGVLQSKHAAGSEPPRLAVSRGDGKGPLQNDAELRCGRRMVETVFEVLHAPARVESSEERTRGRKVASDVDRRRRRREVRLVQLGRHVLKVRISVGRAIEPRVGEMRRIAAVLAARCAGTPRQGHKSENERERLGLPAHRLTPLLRPAFTSSPSSLLYDGPDARESSTIQGGWLATKPDAAPAATALATISIGADAGGVDRLRPALDLGRQIVGEIFGRAALGRHDFEAELLEPLADGGVVEGVAHGLVELAHDRL